MTNQLSWYQIKAVEYDNGISRLRDGEVLILNNIGQINVRGYHLYLWYPQAETKMTHTAAYSYWSTKL